MREGKSLDSQQVFSPVTQPYRLTKKPGPKKGSPPPLTAWKPGQSGNPAGVGKAVAEARAIFGRASANLARLLVERAEEGDYQSTQLALAYGLGKPKESLEITHDASEDVKQIATASLMLRLREIQAKESALLSGEVVEAQCVAK